MEKLNSIISTTKHKAKSFSYVSYWVYPITQPNADVTSSKYGRYLLTDIILKDGAFSQQLNIESYWCHMESMAASNYMECKVNQ